jgi:hypothetical protein
MAIKDPIVLVFSIMTTSQLLGLSFVQFFPTCVSIFQFAGVRLLNEPTTQFNSDPWFFDYHQPPPRSVRCCFSLAWALLILNTGLRGL